MRYHEIIIGYVKQDIRNVIDSFLGSWFFYNVVSRWIENTELIMKYNNLLAIIIAIGWVIWHVFTFIHKKRSIRFNLILEKLKRLYGSFPEILQKANEEIKLGIDISLIVGLEKAFKRFRAGNNIEESFRDLNSAFINPLYLPVKKLRESIEEKKCSDKLKGEFELLKDSYFDVAKELNTMQDKSKINICDFRYIFIK